MGLTSREYNPLQFGWPQAPLPVDLDTHLEGSLMKLANQQSRPRILLGIPVYNEQDYVAKVLHEVRRYARDILVIDDGSTDSTPALLARQPVEVIRHAENRGYGCSMQDMLRWAKFDGFDWLITMDCDEQHEPASIPQFIERIQADESDVISGSRYLEITAEDDAP